MSDLLAKKISFANEIAIAVAKIEGLSEATQKSIESNLKAQPEPLLWDVANIMGQYYNLNDCTAQTTELLKNLIEKIRIFEGERALVSTAKTTIVLGTSGWRGVIGEDFTLLNIHKVLRSITELLQSELYLNYNTFKNFEEVKTRGILVMSDNRFMGEVWREAAKKELTSLGIKVFDAGMCPTGVGSAFVKHNGLAGLVNFTPSHNPMEYAGIKFNPADGGGAESDLTSVIADRANELINDAEFKPATELNAQLVETVDGASFFEKYISETSKVFNLNLIRNWLKENRNDLYLVVDFMHGASRGYVQALLGTKLWNELAQAGTIVTRNENDDYSFHGMRPEPSAVNQKPIVEMLKAGRRKFTLGVSMDPDADRIRYADADMDVDMNLFAPIAYAALLEKGIKGGIVNSVPSSGFPAKIARENGQISVETMVGFKNFRSQFLSGDYVMGFEESDGISFIGHTLEKCALAGFLSGLTALATTNTNISVQYNALREKYGYFYPGRAGVDVRGVSVEAWQAYKKEVVEVLQNRLFKVGDKVNFAGETKTISKLNTIDGLKVFFEDDSWILMRPSGTEPKFRYYYEVVSEEPLQEAQAKAALELYNKTAAQILQQARDLVD